MRSQFPLARGLAVGLLGCLAAACSQESARWADPFTNPFQWRREASAAPEQPAAAQPTPAVESRPLANAPTPQPTPVATAAPRAVPAAPAPAVAARAPQTPATTGTVTRREPGWTWDGGTAVTVQPGETVATLSRRYGVPEHAILRANNLADGARIQPGQRIVIPVYNAGTATPAGAKPAPAPAARSFEHVVVSGDTLYSLARRYKKSPGEIARANGLTDRSTLRIGQRIAIPGMALASKPASTPARTARAAASQPKADRRAEAPKLTPSFAPPPAPPKAKESPAPETVAAVKPTTEPEKPATVAPLKFRWPVQGRIISAFGPKPNGQHNDGINLAVPEGTPIKAAEDGVVAYAGNELKGYGNLVLIRHSDGWVTAYAHNSQLLVRRGDTVKRGQVIARAGQTGGVQVPQLHFEIRKGSTPVDPTQHLTAG
jgi:murein DD-endopeptidase MepM/ murein hydrolase activator NlpD